MGKKKRAKSKAPKVRLESPLGGWSSQRIVEVKGRVSDGKIKRAVLLLNGSAKGLPLRGGRFSTKLVMSPGVNTIRVIAQNRYGVGSGAVTLYSKVPAKALKIILNWDTAGTDVDLWVVDPRGEKCYYRNRKTRIGGKLDTDVTRGFGPETFTLGHAVPGAYRVIAHYYRSQQNIPTEVKLEVVQHEGTPRESRRIYRGALLRDKQELKVAVIHVQ